MSRRIAVLGSGGMSTAMAILLARDAGHEVRLWSRSEDYAAELRQTRVNTRHLPGTVIPPQIVISSRADEVTADADLLLAGIPSAYLRTVLSGLAPQISGTAPVVSVIKGVEAGSLKSPSQIIGETLPGRSVIVLGGPGHAEEIADRLPTSQVAACPDHTAAELVQQTFSTDRFRVYVTNDLKGVELAGALKNVIAIAAGICDGLGFGDNAKSALISRALKEMIRFGAVMGAADETFVGLAGIGDLMTTCFSRHSRNRMVGERLARGETLSAITASMSSVAEGVFSTRSLVEIARQHGVEMPISTEVMRVLHEGRSPAAATAALMTRPLQYE